MFLAIRQHPAVDDCTGGVVWETSVALAMFLESNFKTIFGPVLDRKHIVVEVTFVVPTQMLASTKHTCYPGTHKLQQLQL